MSVSSDRIGRCPACGKELDLLLAPALAVLDGRVVPFCSEACRTAYLEGESAGSRGPEAEAKAPRRRGLLSRLFGSTHFLWASAVLLGMGSLGLLGYGLRSPDTGRGQHAVSVARAREPAGRGQAGKSGNGAAAVVQKAPKLRPSLWSRARSEAIRQLASPVFRDRVLAAEALVHCCQDAKARKVLRNGVRDPFWSNRRLAAEVLGRLGDELGRKVLEEQLDSRRRPVRMAAALTLARLGSKAGLKVLRPYLSSRRYRVSCAEALLPTGYGRAPKVLWKVVDSKKAGGWERLRALAALASAGDGKAVARLRPVLRQADAPWPVVEALARQGLSEALDRLEKALAYPALRVEAARILGRKGIRPSLQALDRDLEARQAGIRATAAAAVLWLGGRTP